MPPRDATPLRRSDARGRYVVVPRRHWPDYECDELEGRGWLGLIEGFEGSGARVAFVHATNEQGLPWEPELMALAALEPY